MSQNNEQTVKDLMKLHDDASDARHLHGSHLYNRHALKAQLDFECALRAALAAQTEKLDQLHQYEEIAEHYAKCAISPEALRDWVVTAQAGQSEPVAWAIFAGNGNMRLWSRKESYVQAQGDELGLPLVPLYTHPAPARQRLMDDEIDALWDEPLTLPQKVQRRYIARAVEAKITGATHD